MTRHEFRRFDDVHAVLRSPHFAPPGTPASVHDTAHRIVHRHVREQLPDTRVAALHDALVREAHTRLARAHHGPICFARDVAQPWASVAAAALLDLPPDAIAHAIPHATVIFAAAAHSHDGMPTATANDAAMALLAQLPQPHPALVQSIVALTQSLPALLTNTLHALIANPAEYRWLRANGATAAGRTSAAHELLRHATPTRRVYRLARCDVTVGGHYLRTHDLVALHLAAANRDVTRFPAGDRLSLADGRAGSLSFGVGAHHCSGSGVVHRLLECMLDALVTSDLWLDLAADGHVEWLDGAAMRAVQRLPVRGRRTTPAPPPPCAPP